MTAKRSLSPLDTGKIYNWLSSEGDDYLNRVQPSLAQLSEYLTTKLNLTIQPTPDQMKNVLKKLGCGYRSPRSRVASQNTWSPIKATEVRQHIHDLANILSRIDSDIAFTRGVEATYTNTLQRIIEATKPEV